MKIWASHPKPKQGELLSSWVMRIAAECGMNAHEFCKSILSIPKPNLRILDRSPDDSLLKRISEGSGVSIDRAREASLLTEEGYVFSQAGTGETSWLIPVITSHSKLIKHTFGMAYCPACLHNDETPYYRKQWLYAFYPICPTHRIPLRNYCPHCKFPYTHTQPTTPRKNTNLALPFRSCWFCGQDLGNMEQSPSSISELSDRALTIQLSLTEGIDTGTFLVPEYGHVHIRAYLDTLHCIINSMTKGLYRNDRINYVRKKASINFAISAKFLEGNYFEHMSAGRRAETLLLANWLMGEWPKRLLSYAQDLNITRSGLFSSIDEPYWLLKTAIPSLQASMSDFRSNEEIENVAALLRSKLKRRATPSEIKEFMTLGYLGDHTAERMAARKAVLAWHKKFSDEWKEAQEAAKRRRMAWAIRHAKSKKSKVQNNIQVAKPLDEEDESK